MRRNEPSSNFRACLTLGDTALDPRNAAGDKLDADDCTENPKA
jgi:hypothetical protein